VHKERKYRSENFQAGAGIVSLDIMKILFAGFWISTKKSLQSCATWSQTGEKTQP
jgi:hypothetical protein